MNEIVRIINSTGLKSAKKIPSTCLILICTLSLNTAFAADWFYRPKDGGPYGNSNGLSYENAWHLSNSATAIGAIDWSLIQPGETLYVGGVHDAGYLDNNIIPNLSGQPGAHIIIDGKMPRFPGAVNSEDFDPGTYVGVGKRVANEWIGPDQFGAWSQPFNSAAYALERIGGDNLVRLIKQTAPPDASWLPGSFYQSGNGATLYYKPTSGDPNNAGHYFYSEGNEPVQIKDVDYITVRNLIIIGGNRGIEVSNAQGIHIENNHLYWQSNIAIRVGSNSDTGKLIGNEIHDVANGIYFVSTQTVNNSDDWHVAYNEVYNVDQYGYYGHNDSHAMGFQGGNDHLVEYNHLHHGAGIPLIFFSYNNFDQELKNNTIRFNFIHDIENFSSSLAIDDAFWYGNINKETPSLSAVQGNVFHHNIIANIKGIGIRTKSWISESGANWKFMHNIVSNANVSFAWHEFSNGVTGIDFENNISLNPITAHLDQLSDDVNDDHNGMLMNNNIYWPDGDIVNPGFEWAGEIYPTLALWQVASSKGGNSVALDPLLISPTGGDFRWNGIPAILPGLGDFSPALAISPVVDAATALGFTTDDIEGNTRSAPFDIGAYEFQDSDGDQLANALELLLGTNPGLSDTDGDNISDYDELNYGGDATTYSADNDLDPLTADTDMDSYDDGLEIAAGSNPLDNNSTPAFGDINNDGLINAADSLLVIQIVLGTYSPTAGEVARADVAPISTGTPAPDGQINTGDMLIILRLALGQLNL